MFCTRCGNELSTESKFCSRCGQPAPVMPPVTSGAVPVDPVAASAPQSPPLTATPVKQRYAGFWIRFVAYLIDQLLISVVSFVFVVMGIVFSIGSITSISELEDPDPAAIIAMLGGWIIFGILSTIAQWLYFAMMESSSMRGTLGKLALGLQVIDARGQTISFGRATGRYFGKILSGLILMLGYIMAGFTARKQALHDMLADTYVIRSRAEVYE
jgi:uncharacterized RDD family membrane protein YckC